MVREPKIFLFDEPLSNLDAALRVQMRIELARLHDRLNATMIYVTHDQVEAMTLADKIVVLRDGRVEQMGSPLELYHHPVNRFVAGFIGSPTMNFIDVKVKSTGSDGVTVELSNGNTVTVPVTAAGMEPGGALVLGFARSIFIRRMTAFWMVKSWWWSGWAGRPIFTSRTLQPRS